MKKFETGRKISWKWGTGTGEGKITEIFTSDVTRELQGAEVTRNASEDEPAYLIEQDDGSEVLKSHSEIEAV